MSAEIEIAGIQIPQSDWDATKRECQSGGNSFE